MPPNHLRMQKKKKQWLWDSTSLSTQHTHPVNGTISFANLQQIIAIEAAQDCSLDKSLNFWGNGGLPKHASENLFVETGDG